VTSIKAIYETELADTRKLLDELAKEKAKLQIDAGKYKSELDELKDKYVRKCILCFMLNIELLHVITTVGCYYLL
jgi:hypothetical protein